MITMKERKAEAAGYRALTQGYRLPGEQAMLDAVLADLRRGNISHVLVKDGAGVAVWRRGAALPGGNPKVETRNPKQFGRLAGGRRSCR